MVDTTRTVDIIFKGKDLVSSTVANMDAAFEDLGEETERTGKKAKEAEKAYIGYSGKPKKAVDQLTTAFQALAASLIVKDFIDANVAFESFERTMTLVTGSSQEAAKEFEYLKDLSNTLGLEVLSTAKNYANLAAATKGTALAGADTREIFEAVSIAMAALGKPAADTSRALLAITQIASKGKVSMEELRNQLGENLPGALGIAERSMDKTTQEFDKLVSSGNLLAVDFLPKFSQGLKSAFGDVAPVDTYVAALNRLKNSVTEAELQLGRGGGFTALTKVVQTGTLAVLGSIAAFEVLGTAIGSVIGAISTGNFSQLGDVLGEAMAEAAASTRDARDAFLGVDDAAKDVSTTVKTIVRDNGDLWKLPPIEAYNKELSKTAKNAEKAAVQLEKIASDERIANIEAKLSLNIAELETQSQVAIATIETLGESIQGTADLLGGLFGNLGSADSLREKFQIEKQIETENKRRQEQLELQEKLTNAQIREINARTSALRKGDATIKVNGDGLQPHLEAFMFEILEAIQVRVNSDGLQQLLGT